MNDKTIAQIHQTATLAHGDAGKANHRLDAIEKDSVQHNIRLDKIESLLDGDTVRAAKADSNYIRWLYRACHARVMLLREVVHIHPKEFALHRRIIQAFDYSDNWWMAMDSMAISEQIKRVMEGEQ